MKRIIACFFVLALLLSLIPASVSAGDRTQGIVFYRQSFSDVSIPENAGVRKGKKGEDSFSLSVSDGALVINNHSDVKSYTMLPFFNDESDYTALVTFSFSDVKTSNAYFALILSSKGDDPDNVTDLKIRSNGMCDLFGYLGDELSKNIQSGANVTFSVKVSHGMITAMSVSAGNVTRRISLKNVVDAGEGNIGFIVRNTDVKVYDFTVFSGMDYSNSEDFSDVSSVWTDDNPYSEQCFDLMTASCGELDTFVLSPDTGDQIAMYIALVVVSAVLIVILIKTRKR